MPQNDWRTAPWVPQALGAVASFLVGVAGNVVSDDMGYRWTPVALAVPGMLSAGWWIRRYPSRSPLVRWFVHGCTAGALATAGLSVLLPGPVSAGLLIVAAGLTAAAVVATSADIGRLLLGMLFAAGGVALVWRGVAGSPEGPFAAAARTVIGALIGLAGLMLIRGLWRAAGRVVTVVGVLFLTTAGLVFLSGGPPVPALVFGSLGATAVAIGTTVIARPADLEDAARALRRPAAASLALTFLSLAVLAALDDRYLLAVADGFGGAMIAVAVVRALVRGHTDVNWSLPALGPACVVDGLETAAHGYTLGGVVTLLAGAGLLLGGCALLRDPAVAFWQRAKAAP